MDLTASKQKLEEDIRVKKNSIAIHQVTLMMVIFMRIMTSTPKPGSFGKTYDNVPLIQVYGDNLAPREGWLHCEPASRFQRSAVSSCVEKHRGEGSGFPPQKCSRSCIVCYYLEESRYHHVECIKRQSTKKMSKVFNAVQCRSAWKSAEEKVQSLHHRNVENLALFAIWNSPDIIMMPFLCEVQ